MTLGLLVGRFGDFVREQRDAAASEPAEEIHDPLAHERVLIAPHMIPLALLAKCDGNNDVAEQAVMFDHAVAVLAMKGEPVADADKEALKLYIAGLRPSLVQLDPALKLLEQEKPDAIAALLAAAKKLVMADGNTDSAEAHLLDELQQELTKH